jgi:hypothetical protein
MSTQGSIGMPQEQNETINHEIGEESQASKSALKTIGVLFVHGIGVQKRGDTLFQCGSAIHNWMQEWISQPSIEEGSNLVDFLDTSLTQSTSDEPAHSRLIIHKKDLIADRSFLLAESCWAEAFHPPRYREFARWALWVLPITVSLHVVRSFSRNLRILTKAGNALRTEQISFEDFKQLQIDIGPSYGSLPTEWPALRKILSDQAYHAGKRWAMSPLALVAFLFFAIFLQGMLLAMIVIGFLPVDFLRSFVNLVQKKVAAILGDCYLFVTSPISASAAVTQFKKDFKWIADRCDKVVILAQ